MRATCVKHSAIKSSEITGSLQENLSHESHPRKTRTGQVLSSWAAHSALSRSVGMAVLTKPRQRFSKLRGRKQTLGEADFRAQRTGLRAEDPLVPAWVLPNLIGMEVPGSQGPLSTWHGLALSVSGVKPTFRHLTWFLPHWQPDHLPPRVGAEKKKRPPLP